MNIIPLKLETSDKDKMTIEEFNKLHQAVFDLLVSASGLSPALLQPKAHLSAHADLLENCLLIRAMNYRRKDK